MSERPNAEKDVPEISLDTARLPDPDIAATGDGRVIAAALNALTSELRLTNLLLAQSMQDAAGSIVYAGRHDAIRRVVNERLLYVLPPADRSGYDFPPYSDPEPQPSDGPEYHAEHAAWSARQTRVLPPGNPASQGESHE